MTARGRHSDLILMTLQRELPDVPKESLEMAVDKFANSAFDLAFNFGKSCGWDEAEEILEKLRNSSKSARQLALEANRYVESGGVDYNSLVDFVLKWQKDYIENSDYT